MSFLKKIILFLKYKWLTYCMQKLPKPTAKAWCVVVKTIEQGVGTAKIDIDTGKELMREVISIVYRKNIVMRLLLTLLLREEKLLLSAYLRCAQHVMNFVNAESAKLPSSEGGGGSKYDLSAYYTIKHFYLQLIRAFNWTEEAIDKMYVDDLFDLMSVANETAEKPEDEREAYIDEIL